MFFVMTFLSVEWYRVGRCASEQPLEEEHRAYYDAETEQAGKNQFDGLRHALPPSIGPVIRLSRLTGEPKRVMAGFGSRSPGGGVGPQPPPGRETPVLVEQ